VVLCSVVLLLVYTLNKAPSVPPVPAAALCTQLKSQDYADMYTGLSPRLQAEGTQAQFAASQEQLDVQNGKTTTCSVTVQRADPAQATVSVALNRERGGATTVQVQYITVSGVWRLDSYDSSVI
jgi:VCBS repeat-containing protein